MQTASAVESAELSEKTSNRGLPAILAEDIIVANPYASLMSTICRPLRGEK
ncbi:hypothetical protein T190_30225 [Sinorhizobium meliloti CCBAU 01290]|nr:hypothetical protein T190_30225 [Sinorhizobium meliloti CCBAU 01290]